MGDHAGDLTIPFRRRKELALKIPGFAALPDAVVETLATKLHEEKYVSGKIVVAEGEVGDRLFLIEKGHAEVFTSGQHGLVPLAKLGPGDLFGEIALLIPTRRRQATVKATTALVALSLASTTLHDALSEHPEARIDLVAKADALLTAKYLKRLATERRR
jgi:CRP-like cAMP-binding protein